MEPQQQVAHPAELQRAKRRVLRALEELRALQVPPEGRTVALNAIQEIAESVTASLLHFEEL